MIFIFTLTNEETGVAKMNFNESVFIGGSVLPRVKSLLSPYNV